MIVSATSMVPRSTIFRRTSAERSKGIRTGSPGLVGRAVRTIALHEIGHLLGLDHTRDETSVMFPRVRVTRLAPADLATAVLLYQLPPGAVTTDTLKKPIR